VVEAREALLRLLAEGSLRIDGRLRAASNAALFGEVSATGRRTAVIYKPIAGERPLVDFPTGTLANRERAAFLLSEATGWQIVPPTVLREGPFGPGMVQAWTTADASIDLVAMISAPDDRLRRICVYDVLANNADRKGGHLLPTPDGQIVAIDHGLCFAAEPKLRTVLWAWRGQALEADELAAVRRVSAALDGHLAAQLDELLSPAETRALLARTEALLVAGRFPQPDPHRPALPWPPF
jgi:hypothetical protein